jgi:hypothetical protein
MRHEAFAGGVRSRRSRQKIPPGKIFFIFFFGIFFLCILVIVFR